MSESKVMRLQILLSETENDQYDEYCKLKDKSRNNAGREIILTQIRK